MRAESRNYLIPGKDSWPFLGARPSRTAQPGAAATIAGTPLPARATPTPVTGSSEFASANRHANAIETQWHHRLRLANDLLDLGTIEAGKLKLQRDAVARRALEEREQK
jgi:hypothetical protein